MCADKARAKRIKHWLASLPKRKGTSSGRAPLLSWFVSEAEKTGVVLACAVGETRAEAWESCEGCPERARRCYAHYGTPGMALGSIERATQTGRGYALADALHDAREAGVKLCRIGTIGDPARASAVQRDSDIEAVRAAGYDIVGYTHFPGEVPHLRRTLMASASDMSAAVRYVADGWRVAVVAPHGTTGTLDTPAGRLLECPAIAAERHGRTYTCVDCASTRRGALCDASRADTLPGAGVYFADHGPQKLQKGRLPLVA